MQAFHRAGTFAVLAAILAVAGLCSSVRQAPADGEVKKNSKYPQHILIIRHAEKTGEKDDIHLNKQGKERAVALEGLFKTSRERPDPFPTPDFIFAATHHKDSQRPVETVTPLAGKLKLPIVDRYDSKVPAKKEGMVELRDEIFGSEKYFGKTILVAWRHKTIPNLAQTLRASKVPPVWEDRVFDRVWQIDYDDSGNATFRDRPQRLLPGDAEK
jgi:hypothetical protein